LSDEERRRSWNPAIATRTDLELTGELCFEITTWISEPIKKRWRDGKRKKLEEQLGELVAGFQGRCHREGVGANQGGKRALEAGIGKAADGAATASTN
jgi:hypothetical protein